MHARMSTMPVIEQAKGIIIVWQGCGPDEAFDVLRRISQRTNVKLHVVAAQIVERTASSRNHDNVTSIALGGRRYRAQRIADTALPRPD
jgi:hypothetical protein